nr:lytic murein transglycosylase [Herbihabitans rhizosphaerae]
METEVDAPPPPRADRRRGLGALGRLALVLVVLAAAGGGVWLLSDAASPEAGPVALEIPAAQVKAAPVEPGTVVPAGVGGELPPQVANEQVVAQPRPQPQGTGNGRDPLSGWAARTAAVTGIPARALWSYGNAELAMRAAQSSCRISWATLAGIGRIESNHGQYGGASLGADGRPSKPVIGVPLDGSAGVKAIGDTDGGMFDGDPTVDRAVGPMQFIPSTWRRWASDGNGDGRGDPHQLDDAAVAAARYLCANGRDMGGAKGWWDGVFSYNNSVPYGQKVFGLADGYARAAQSAAR